MNDFDMIVSIRELPEPYVKPGVNLTRFGESGIVAAHPDLPAMLFKDKKWRRLTMRQVNKR